MSSFKNFGLHLKNNSISPVAITGHLGIFANGDQVSVVNSQGTLRDLRTRDLISDSVHISGSSYFKGTLNALGDVVVAGNEAISGSLSVNGNLNIGSLVATSGSLSSLTVTNNATISGSLRAISGLSVGNSNGYSFPTTKGLEGTVLGVSGSQVSFMPLSNYALVSSLPSVTGSCLTVNSNAVSGNWLIGSNLIVNGSSLTYGNSSISGSLNVTGNEVIFGNVTISGSTLTSNLKTNGNFLATGNVNISGNLNVTSNVVTSGTLGFKGYNIVPISGTFMVTPDMVGKIIHLTGPSNILLPQALNFTGDHYSFKAATNDSSIISGGIGTIDTLETLGLTGLSFKEVYFYGSNWFTK